MQFYTFCTYWRIPPLPGRFWLTRRQTSTSKKEWKFFPLYCRYSAEKKHWNKKEISIPIHRWKIGPKLFRLCFLGHRKVYAYAILKLQKNMKTMTKVLFLIILKNTLFNEKPRQYLKSTCDHRIIFCWLSVTP